MKYRAIVLCAVAGILASTASASDIRSYQPNPGDLYDLDHHKAYKWGFDLGLADGESITEARLILHSIRNWNDGPNVLYIHLLDYADLGVEIFTDNENPTDYFDGQGIELVTYVNLPSTPQTRIYDLTPAQVATLNSYSDWPDDRIGLAFDPDCHYWNCGVEFKAMVVPEPATVALLLLAGLPALAARRRSL